jgi:repressor LexA
MHVESGGTAARERGPAGALQRPLTARQREVLEFVRRFAAEQGYPPTVREIGGHFGFVPRSVFDHLRAIERKGYLRRRSSKARSLEILDGGGRSVRAPAGVAVPIVGRVAAGAPLLAEQNLEGTLPVPAEWAGGDQTFLLRVQGESMVGAHILPGDFVLVRRQTTAEHGDIVVALLNDEATVKRLLFKGDHVHLKPENAAMKPIIVRRGDARFQILGKVTGVLRRL